MTSTQQCEHAQVIVAPTGSELLPGGVNHGKYVKESRVQWSLKATVQSRGPNGGLYIKGDKDAPKTSSVVSYYRTGLVYGQEM